MSRFRRLFHLGTADDEVEWELRHHFEERIDELMAGGRTREEAAREARRAFGDLEQVRSDMRALSRSREHRLHLRRELGAAWEDVLHALRRLRSSPGFALIAIVVLGLGIGANTAIFSALRAALLKAPPYPDPERLVVVDLLLSDPTGLPADTLPWSYPKFEAARERLRSVTPVAGYFPTTVTLTGAGDAARVGIEYVSPAYLGLLGVRPVLGRAFGPGEEPPAPGTVAILSHALWRTRFGGDPAVVGRRVMLDGVAVEVVGVLPAGFQGLSGSADLLVPMAGIASIRGPRRLQLAQAHWLRVVGRLRPGATLAQARHEGELLGREITARFADGRGRSSGVTMVPLMRARVNPIARLAVGAVALGAALLLLIACGNVAGLLLARASARRVDVAVRSALGASRRRLVRESLAESLLLASAGGALGLLLALVGQHVVSRAVRYALDTSGTRSLQFLDPNALGIDGGVLAAGIAVALATGLLVGLLPARAASRPDLTRDLRAGGRGGIGARRGDAGRAGRGALVAAQLALTLVLLAGAGLMAASFAHLTSIDFGFDHGRVLALTYDRGTDTSPDQDRVFDASLLERLSSLPGVESAALAPCAPVAGRCDITAVQRLDDEPQADGSEMQPIVTLFVSDDYLRTLGIRLRAGRALGPQDVPGAPVSALISEAAARALFAGASPIGHRIAVSHEVTDSTMATIVGVVADVRYGDPEEPALPTIYFSRGRAPSSEGTIFVRTRGEPYALLDGVRRVVASLDRDVPLFDVSTMAERRSAASARTRVVLWLLAAFAGAGLLLSAVGLYGLVAYAAVRRTPEMGVRIALGATGRDVLRLMMTYPALLALAGVGGGVAGAAALTRYAAALLYGVQPSDPRILAAAALAHLAAAAAAAWVPARRATRIDPVEALRGE